MKKPVLFLLTLCSLGLVGCAGLEPDLKPRSMAAAWEADEPIYSGPMERRAPEITYAETQACAQTSLLGRGTVDSRGVLHQGKLSVRPGHRGEPARVDIVCFDAQGQGRSYAISVTELKKIPVIRGLSYGVSTDGRLLLIREESGVWVLRDREGNYDPSDFKDFNKDAYSDLRDLLREGYVLTPGRSTEDGRIDVLSVPRSESSADFRFIVRDILGALPGFR